MQARDNYVFFYGPFFSFLISYTRVFHDIYHVILSYLICFYVTTFLYIVMLSFRTLKSAFLLSQRTFATSSFENVLVEIRDRVGLVTLNRPKALNALNDGLVSDLYHQMPD